MEQHSNINDNEVFKTIWPLTIGLVSGLAVNQGFKTIGILSIGFVSGLAVNYFVTSKMFDPVEMVYFSVICVSFAASLSAQLL